ncbi:MAG: single-stranded DNA-binding protein [Bacteroidales bacterium]|nr:single-stranded DNA-binding protein [Bacteroidales bacterium]MDY0217260.1 single-stranded DNA-binding protein [Bacteroidales bacterium]
MSTSLNRVELKGNAGRDGELVELNKGNALLKFSLATSESYQRRNGELVNNTTWHNIVLWGDDARKALPIVKKGARLHVIGKIVTNEYVDKEGIKRMVFNIQASEVTSVFDGIRNEAEKIEEKL